MKTHPRTPRAVGTVEPHVAPVELTRNRVELVPWSMAATNGPNVIRCEDAAMSPFIGNPRAGGSELD